MFVAIGVLSETFETAITWERFPAFHERVIEAVTSALVDVCGGGSVTCRFTHVYPDGPAPYYTILAPARRGAIRRHRMLLEEHLASVYANPVERAFACTPDRLGIGGRPTTGAVAPGDR